MKFIKRHEMTISGDDVTFLAGTFILSGTNTEDSDGQIREIPYREVAGLIKKGIVEED